MNSKKYKRKTVTEIMSTKSTKTETMSRKKAGTETMSAKDTMTETMSVKKATAENIAVILFEKITSSCKKMIIEDDQVMINKITSTGKRLMINYLIQYFHVSLFSVSSSVHLYGKIIYSLSE